MLENVLDIERSAFLWLNGGHTAFWDSFMWIYSGRAVWIPAAVVILIMLIYKNKPAASLLVLLLLVLTLTACDQFASSVCKPLFTRLRPTQHPDFMYDVLTVNGYRGGKYGFISSHAANAFGLAVFLSLLLRDRLFTATILIWAVIMCYSRIYLGVHFISDIVPGIAVGALFGFIGYKLYDFIVAKLSERVGGGGITLATGRKRIIVFGIWATMAYILIFSVLKII